MKAEPETQTADMDVAILGAGIAGLCAADLLRKAGLSVCLIEQTDRCGGTHNSAEIGPYTFDYGSIFYEEAARLFDLDGASREACPQVKRRQRRISPQGKLAHYPMEPREMLRGSKPRFIASVIDLALSRLLVRRDGTLKAIVRNRLGRRFFEDTGLAFYIGRFHHCPSSEIDEQFFFERMRFVDRFTRMGDLVKAGWRSVTSKKAINAKTRKPLYIRPRAGFDALFAPIRSALEARGVSFHMGETLAQITPVEDGQLIRTDKGEYRARSVVSTIPLDATHQALFGTPTGLEAIDMVTLFVSAETLDADAGNVLFNFHREGRWKRATIYSRLYDGADTEREFLSVEVTLQHGEAPDAEALFADFAAHVETLGLATGLTLEGHTFLSACYPLFTRGSEELRHKAIRRVSEAGVIPAGRQGRFAYLPTSSGVIRQVNRVLQQAGISQTE